MLSQISQNYYRRVKEILERALDLESGAQRKFLREACAGDERLLAEAESLLAAHEESADFLEDVSPIRVVQKLIGAGAGRGSNDDYAGRIIGNYRLIREIGRGGMGVVYLATREDFRQEAAIKLIKRGMDSDAILERFAREREILAGLNHPFIAHLLDGGTTDDGIPYFVMEYIEGVPVDCYCREHNLSPKETLALFRKICEAVSFAHQKLIIHRDLKPSNILVTPSGAPKLLDFGIAKVLSAAGGRDTQTEQRVLTPAYAAPEQIAGNLPVDTTSDVYSLGKILAELLEISNAGQRRTGNGKSATTNGEKTADSLITRIKDISQTARLRAAAPSKDLQDILAMSLRPEAGRRYRSVEQFSEDVRRYLSDLPIIARKDSFAYRATKFARRNRIAAGITLLFVLSLIGGLATTLRQYRRAQIAQARAERRFEDVRQLANSFMFELNDAIGRSPTEARALLVRRALEYLDSLAEESGGDAELERELATAYMKLGDIQSTPYVANTGDTAGSLASFGKAVSLLEPLAAKSPADNETWRLLSDAEEGLGKRQSLVNDHRQAFANQQKAFTIRQHLASLDEDNIEYQRLLATSYQRLGDALSAQETTDKSDLSSQTIDYYQKSLSLRQTIVASGGTSKDKYVEAVSHQRLATRYEKSPEGSQKIAQMRLALAERETARRICEPLAQAEPGNLQYQRCFITMTADVASLKFDLGENVKDALKDYEVAVAELVKLSSADPTNTELRRDLAQFDKTSAELYDRAGDQAHAVSAGSEAVRLFEALLKEDAARINDTRPDLNLAYQTLSRLLRKNGDEAGAAEYERKASSLNR